MHIFVFLLLRTGDGTLGREDNPKSLNMMEFEQGLGSRERENVKGLF